MASAAEDTTAGIVLAGGGEKGARIRAFDSFRGVFNLGLIGMAITSTTRGCIEVNDELCRILGYERHELLKKTWSEMTHPDDLAADVAQFDRVTRGEIDGYSMDKRWIRKDGRIVHSIISVKSLRAPDGSVDHFVALLQDITARKEAEDQVRRSKALLAEAEQIAHLGSWTFDVATRNVIWSDEHYRLLGMDPVKGGATYEDGERSMHPDDRLGFNVLIEQALRDHQPLECRWRMALPDGTLRIMYSRGQVEVDGAGNPVRMFGTTQDVTETMRAEEALRNSERSLASELASMARLQEVSTRLVPTGDATSLLQEMVDAAITITAADKGNIQLFDRETGTLKIVASRGFGRPFLDFFNAVHGGEAACGTALRTVQRVVIEDVDASPIFAGSPALDVLRAAGVRAVQSTPLVNRAGEPVGALSTHYRTPRRPAERDLHVLDLLARQAADWIERTQTEAELRSSEERIRSLLSLMPAAVYTCDAEGRLTLYNRRAAELWGREPQLGDTAPRFCGSVRLWTPAGDPLAHEDAPMAAALRQGRSFRGVETVIEQPGGRRVIVHANIDPLFGPQGQPIGAINVFEDMTERTQAQLEREKLLEKLEAARAEAEAANRAKDEFLAMLGHELRNPLTPILATLQSVRLEGRRPLRSEQSLIERQARLLADMVDDLLDVSRIARGKLKLLRRRIGLSQVVSRSLEATRPVVEERRHQLRVDVPEGLVVNADEGRLVQVVSNLITNAARYTNPSGLIEVTGRREGHFAVLRVRDNGIGLSSALLPRIFERFTQAPRSIDRVQGGLGLGLSIAHHLVLLHGGTVSAASEGPGKGSEFTVRLPLGRATGARMSGVRVPSPKVVQRTAATPHSILIVDDNRDITDVLARMLRARGHAVEVAYDGFSALSVIKRFHPRFALLDIGLPRMNGYEVARLLKRRLGSGAPTLLALTGYGQLSDRRRALSAGFSEHLVKPIDLERLLAIIEQ